MTSSDAPGSRLVVEPLTPERWDDLVAFFGPRGAYSNCWCTWWRQTTPVFQNGCRNEGAGNRKLLRRLTDEGRVPGLLAYAEGEPVGWVSVGPRDEFGRVLRSPNLKPEPEPELKAELKAEPDAGRADSSAEVWSIVCFWIPRPQRRQGIGGALLKAAVDYAASHGATVVEGYPIDTQGARVSSAEIFTGTLEMFERAGFTLIRRRTDRRPVVARTL